MRVRVDQIMCTGAGVCESIAPEVFVVEASGLATVLTDGVAQPDGGGADGVVVPESSVKPVLDAQAVCPGGCIITSEA